jgi:hypothetical protein
MHETRQLKKKHHTPTAHLLHPRGVLIKEKLTALAYFLATMHNRTVFLEQVDFNRDCSRQPNHISSKVLNGIFSPLAGGAHPYYV